MRKARIKPYKGPAGGWGSARSLGEILTREQIPLTGAGVMMKQNKPDGFMCVSCAWAKPAHPRPFEYCENGAKATAWELTRKRVTQDFFAAHTVAELLSWPDHDLEEAGRLTEPMKYDPQSDKYVPVGWDEAFADIGAKLRSFAPKETVFYASGRASLETAYMYALMARLYGCNNLPDSSNMCHESTSVALPPTIGIPVGTVVIEDFAKADCLLFFGQNPGSNSPRMLHDLQAASRRGVPIITFNPLRERGLERFTNPQSPTEMLTGAETLISSQYHQVKAGGDIAAIMGLCKALIALDDSARARGDVLVLDHDFLARHTHGFEDFAQAARRADWAQIGRQSGLSRGALEAAAAVYARSNAAIGIFGMGLTQHRTGVENVQMLVNLLLLRGNIGKEGAGVLPVRGHSNVQGQRTVGITEKPELVPTDRLRELYSFEPPMEKGLNTVEACEAILAGKVKAFIGLGGNFIRAVPDHSVMEPAWRGLKLNAQISTKLNRTHLVLAETNYILPCLGRIEVDQQASGPQSVSIEDTMACIHASKGYKQPASANILSEPRIVAGLAKATLDPNPRVDWDLWASDYARVRDAIELTYPDQFAEFNARMARPGGFHRPLPARHREWKTPTGKANFTVPKSFEEDPDMPERSLDSLRLITLRSNGQFNTTIYNYNDRFRGVTGARMVLFINRNDMDRLGLKEAQTVALVTDVEDGVKREVGGFRVTEYGLPDGCCAGYYPECNPLIPLWHHAEGSKVPASKSIPVRVRV